MFSKQLILFLTITICLSSIQCDDPRKSCPKGQKYVQECMDVVTCQSRVEPARNCDGQCVCEDIFAVRNNENVCIPIWDCPGVCPPNTSIRSCSVNHVPYTAPGLTAEEFSKLCKPKCCMEGLAWISKLNECHRIVDLKSIHDYYIRFG